MTTEDRTAAIRARLEAAVAADRGPWTIAIWPAAEHEADAEAEVRSAAGDVVVSLVGLSAYVALGANAPADIAHLLAENAKLATALQSIADHPCQNRDCCCGPAPEHHSMGRIARMALGLPEPKEDTE